MHGLCVVIGFDFSSVVVLVGVELRGDIMKEKVKVWSQSSASRDLREEAVTLLSNHLVMCAHAPGVSMSPPKLSSDTLQVQHIPYFLLSNDIRSEGNIAILKKFDFDFLMIFHFTSLLQSKNVV